MFYGRESQLADLLALWRKRVSSFVTCRGRRRIGKSTLIEVFADRSDARFIKTFPHHGDLGVLAQVLAGSKKLIMSKSRG